MALPVRLFALLAGPLLAASPVAWPGGAARTSDAAGALGTNVSGLATAAPDALWAVRDGPGSLLRLERRGDTWRVADGWGSGRRLRHASGAGNPDAEAVAVSAKDEGAVYVGAERDNDASTASRNSVLRYRVGTGAGELVATVEWDLTALLPTTRANSGIEGLAWIPDEALVASGFRDDEGVVYAPATHAAHGGGLFAVGVEQDASVHLVLLAENGSAEHLATIATAGARGVMELAWRSGTSELWAACDDTCSGAITVLRIEGGVFVATSLLTPPAALAARNDEGLAFAGTCGATDASVVWADDLAADGHVLREASLPCAPIGAPVGSAAPGTTTVGTGTTGAGTPTIPATTADPAASEGVAPGGDGSPVPWAIVGGAVVVAAAIAAVVKRRRATE